MQLTEMLATGLQRDISAALLMSACLCVACSGSSTSNPASTHVGGASNSSGGATAMANSGGSSAANTGGSAASTVPTGLPATCPGNCDNATPTNPQHTSYGTLGNVTQYTTSASSNGACGYGSTSVMDFAAIDSSLEWNGGHICGQCMQVTVLTSQGPKSIVVRIMDECPDANCGIDLGGSATAVQTDGSGRYEGAWRAVSCVGQTGVSDGAPSLYVKDGASAGWSIVQIRDPNAAVTSIDYTSASGSTSGTLAWSTDAENYWAIPTNVLSANSNFTFTIHYSDGSTGTVTLTSAQLAKASTSYPLD